MLVSPVTAIKRLILIIYVILYDKNVEYWLIYIILEDFSYTFIPILYCKNIYITVTFIFVRFSFTKVNLQDLKSRVAPLYF